MSEIVETKKYEENVIKKKPFLKSLIQSTSITLTVSSCIYTIVTRPLSNFLRYGIYIDGTVVGISALVFIYCIIKFGYRNRPVIEIRAVGLMLLVALPILPLLYYSLAVSIKDLYHWILLPQ